MGFVNPLSMPMSPDMRQRVQKATVDRLSDTSRPAFVPGAGMGGLGVMPLSDQMRQHMLNAMRQRMSGGVSTVPQAPVPEKPPAMNDEFFGRKKLDLSATSPLSLMRSLASPGFGGGPSLGGGLAGLLSSFLRGGGLGSSLRSGFTGPNSFSSPRRAGLKASADPWESIGNTLDGGGL